MHALNNWAHDASSYDVGPLYQCRLAMGSSVNYAFTYLLLARSGKGVFFLFVPQRTFHRSNERSE